MIQINCTNCKALLQIDDAFAGGVCRCRYCGTIQTVPKHLKDANGEGAPSVTAAVGSAKPAKTLYQKKRSAVLDPGAGSGSGLDDLAGIVASSGLSSSRLQKKAGGAQPAGKHDHTLTIVLASAGGLVVLLLGIIIFLALRDRGPVEEKTALNPAPASATPVVVSNKPPEPVQTAEPNFLGQAVDGNNVVFVVDRGASSQTGGRLDLVKQALLRSVRSLGSGRKFAVVFWYIDGTKPQAYPPTGLKPVTSQNIDGLRKFLDDDIYTVGRTEMSLAVEHACKSGADAVVLVPMKTFLEDKFESDVLKARKGSKAKVYCVTMEQPDLAAQLAKIASVTHAQYRDVSLAEVRKIVSGQ
jgi:hypothetical protein